MNGSSAACNSMSIIPFYLLRSRQVLVELCKLFFLLWGGEQFDVNLHLSCVIPFSH